MASISEEINLLKQRIARHKLTLTPEPGKEWSRIRVETLEQMRELCNAPKLAFDYPGLQNDIQLDDAAVITAQNLKKAVAAHTLGLGTITSRKTLTAIRMTFSYFIAAVYTGDEFHDRDVTKENPLIIETPSILIFNKVRIFPGGYIKITAPCSFECASLSKELGEYAGAAAPTHDFTVTGGDGDDGASGDGGAEGAEGSHGTDGACDNAGGCVLREGGKGHKGKIGGDGDDGERGEDGDQAPPVTIRIHDLKNSVSILNVGGKAGRGGHGGKGGKGGKGGRGGNQRHCGGCTAYAGAGGPGGDGGNGGDGNDGGNGGAGAEVVIHFESKNGSEFLKDARRASGGEKGNRGAKGEAGDGGSPGQGGTSPGPAGTEGLPGKDGFPGTQGKLGEFLFNPPTL